MPGEFFFMAIGGLGVSLAGFAGLIAAMDRRPEAHSAIAAWRIRNIVIGGFILTLAGFGIIATYAMTGDNLAVTVRLTALWLILANVIHMVFWARPGPEWPNPTGRRLAIAVTVLILIGYLVVVIRGRLPLLQLILIFQLASPLSIFFNTVRDVARGEVDVAGEQHATTDE